MQVFAFAANPEHHDLNSPNSLHDAWLEYWRIAEIVTTERGRDRCCQIDACFLGSRHDRHIHLEYKNVTQHEIRSVGDPDHRHRQTLHGDLLIHELSVVRDGLFLHELLFATGTVFIVQFTDLVHRVELVAGRTPAAPR